MDNLPAKVRKGFTGWVPSRFRDEFDSIWDNFFNEFDSAFGNCCYENEDGDVIYELEVAGFNKDNIKVQVSDGILEVKGERMLADGERTVGKRSIHKRMSVGDVKEAEAIVKDGILTIKVKYPKEDVKEVKVLDVKDVEE
jgi:HSP20 family molecular chaperone IbpA